MIGNKSTFMCLGASNHSNHDRANEDYYATDPRAATLLLEQMPELQNIWECACGEGHLAKEFEEWGKLAIASDLIDRGYGKTADFLKTNLELEHCFDDIVTNPPYNLAQEFCEHALKIVKTHRFVCMFLKLTFLEGKQRKLFFAQNPPKVVYVCSGRIKCAINGDFDCNGSSPTAYAWFVWQKGFNGNTIIKWIN